MFSSWLWGTRNPANVTERTLPSEAELQAAVRVEGITSSLDAPLLPSYHPVALTQLPDEDWTVLDDAGNVQKNNLSTIVVEAVGQAISLPPLSSAAEDDEKMMNAEREREAAREAAIDALFHDDVNGFQAALFPETKADSIDGSQTVLNEDSQDSSRQDKPTTPQSISYLPSGLFDDYEPDLEAGLSDSGHHLPLPPSSMVSSVNTSQALPSAPLLMPVSTAFCLHALQGPAPRPEEVKQPPAQPVTSVLQQYASPDRNIYKVNGPLAGWARILAPCVESIVAASSSLSQPSLPAAYALGSDLEEALDYGNRLANNAW